MHYFFRVVLFLTDMLKTVMLKQTIDFDFANISDDAFDEGIRWSQHVGSCGHISFSVLAYVVSQQCKQYKHLTLVSGIALTEILQFHRQSDILEPLTFVMLSLNPIQDRSFRGFLRIGGQKGLFSLTPVTHIP